MSKQNPTGRQVDALDEQRTAATERRTWHRPEVHPAGPLARRYRGRPLPGNPLWVHQNADDKGTTRADRRRRARRYDIPLPASPNRPHRNPRRPAKLARSGRLRRDLP